MLRLRWNKFSGSYFALSAVSGITLDGDRSSHCKSFAPRRSRHRQTRAQCPTQAIDSRSGNCHIASVAGSQSYVRHLEPPVVSCGCGLARLRQFTAQWAGVLGTAVTPNAERWKNLHASTRSQKSAVADLDFYNDQTRVTRFWLRGPLAPSRDLYAVPRASRRAAFAFVIGGYGSPLSRGRLRRSWSDRANLNSSASHACSFHLTSLGSHRFPAERATGIRRG
jgi:hypothetical protein